jgi:hypothetical protein
MNGYKTQWKSNVKSITGDGDLKYTEHGETE